MFGTKATFFAVLITFFVYIIDAATLPLFSEKSSVLQLPSMTSVPSSVTGTRTNTDPMTLYRGGRFVLPQTGVTPLPSMTSMPSLAPRPRSLDQAPNLAKASPYPTRTPNPRGSRPAFFGDYFTQSDFTHPRRSTRSAF